MKNNRAARCGLTVGLAIYGLSIARHADGGSLLDNIDLPVHETGHLVFSPFGDFMQFAGGTLFQLIMPAIFVGYFLRRKETHSASVALWWRFPGYKTHRPWHPFYEYAGWLKRFARKPSAKRRTARSCPTTRLERPFSKSRTSGLCRVGSRIICSFAILTLPGKPQVNGQSPLTGASGRVNLEEARPGRG